MSPSMHGRGDGSGVGPGGAGAALAAAARERALIRLLEPGPLAGLISPFLAELCRILPFDWAALVSCEEEPDRTRVRCWTRQDGPAASFAPLPWGGGEISPILAAGPAPREIEDPFLMAALKACGIASALGIPLDESAETPAALLLGRHGAEGFRGNEVSAASPLWPALAIAVRRNRQERNVSRAARDQSAELTALLEIVRTAGSALDLEELFAGIGAALQPATGLDQMAVLLDEGRRARLTLYTARPLTVEATGRIAERCVLTYRNLAHRELQEVNVESATLPGFDPDPAAAMTSAGQFAHRAGEDTGSAPVAELDELSDGFVPALMHGRSAPTGLLALFTGRRPASESLVRLVAATAGQASLTVDRLREGAEREARRLRTVIDSMTDGVVLTDTDLRIGMLNPAARSHLEILTGQPDPETVGDLGGAGLGEIAGDVLEGRSSRAATEIRVASRGKILALTVTAVTGLHGDIRGLVVVTSDVTEDRAMREQMFQTEKLRALGEMISGVAHELNNPLATVMGYAQLLQVSPVSDEVKGRLDLIASEADRCRNVVRNLLSFARRHRPERKAVSLNEVAESVIALLAYQLRVDGIDLKVELDRSIPAANGDYHKLQQVVLNLVTNAHQSLRSESDGAARTVSVRTLSSSGAIVIEVEDDGPGMSPEQRRQAFEPFFTTKPPGEGTGLGLSIVRDTVEEHGGRIELESRPGEGARFRVVLPAGIGPESSAQLAETLESGVRPGSILVVEDEEPVSRMIRDALVADGHDVETACDEREARERIDKRDYDVIISDLKMPGGGGRELYERLHSSRPELAGRFIFATGDVVSAETRRFFDDARRPVLAKPFDLNDLRRMVRETLGQR